jgi:hypothetical protein
VFEFAQAGNLCQGRREGQTPQSWLGHELLAQGAFCLNAIALVNLAIWVDKNRDL